MAAAGKDETSNTIDVLEAQSESTTGFTKVQTDGNHNDTGLDAYTQALELDPVHRDKVAKAVLRKLDFYLLPLVSNRILRFSQEVTHTLQMCAVFMTAFIEKGALNYANAYSLQADLNLVGRDYAWTASIINLGVMVGSYPASLAVQKLPIGKLISGLLVFWGVLSMLVAVTKNFGGIFTIRFLLGLGEAAIGPAWVILTSMFWTRDEQPLRMCFWQGSNGIGLLIGAGISTGLGSVTHTAVRPWQLIFLVS